MKHFTYERDFINISKACCVILSALLIISLFFIPIFSKNSKYRIDLSKRGDYSRGSASFKVANPNLIGLDSSNQHYKISADSGQQDPGDIMRLEGVKADMMLHDGRELRVSADRGTVNVKTNLLDLEGDVRFVFGLYKLNAEWAELNYKDKMMFGNGKVYLDAETYTIRAKSFSWDETEKQLRFLGEVVTILH